MHYDFFSSQFFSITTCTLLFNEQISCRKPFSKNNWDRCRFCWERNNLSLVCNSSGKPKPSITWTKVGSSEVLSTTSVLTVVNVSRPGTPDNVIQYQCSGSNGVGTPAMAVANITVLCKYVPLALLISLFIFSLSHWKNLFFPFKTSPLTKGITRMFWLDLDLPSAPILTTIPSNAKVLRGKILSIICRADANPAAHEYQYYVNDILIGNSSNGLLNITVDVDGSYTCLPINSLGSGHNTTVNVTVVGKSAIKWCIWFLFPARIRELLYWMDSFFRRNRVNRNQDNNRFCCGKEQHLIIL